MFLVSLFSGSHTARAVQALLIVGSAVAITTVQSGLQSVPLGLIPDYIPAAMGNAEAQHTLAHIYQDGSDEKHVVKDEKKALQWFRAAANQQHPESQFDVGSAYEQGAGIAKDIREAARWYKLAAAQGNTSAQCNLGRYYMWSCNEKGSEQKGLELLKKCAEEGDACAIRSLAACYEEGTGVEKDLAYAVELYERAAEDDDGYAQCRLGDLYETGTGVEKNLNKAFGYFEAAARNGESDAEIELATLYSLGAGVKRNEAEALRHFRAAAKAGDSVAKSYLDSREMDDAKDSPDYSVYMSRLQKSIKVKWDPIDDNRSRTATVHFKVRQDGSMSDLEIFKSSGKDDQDAQALLAVNEAAPFLPLPKGAPDLVDIEFSFDYNVKK